MTSILARRTTQVVYNGGLHTHTRRQIYLSVPAQNGWFGNLLRGSKPAENVEASEEVELQTPNGPTTAASATPDGTVESTPSDTSDAAKPTSVTKSRQKAKRKPLSPEAKTLRFQENLAFLTPRLGRRPELKLPRIKKTTWIRTLGVCQTEDELRKVMELFPSWRDMGNRFDDTLSEAFIRRCIILKKPEIALELFGNYAKYHVPLSLTGARELLHATYDTQPIRFVITLTSLFDVYKLPPVAQDLPSCSMVISACLKDGRRDAMVIATTFIPHLKKILDQTKPQPIPKTQEKGDDMPRVWTSWALKKVDEQLSKTKQKKLEWLRDWRLRSGHIASA